MNIVTNITQNKIKQRIEEKLYDRVTSDTGSDRAIEGSIVKDKAEHIPAAETQQTSTTPRMTVKDFIKRIPIISNIATWISRLKKMPWRVLHTDEELQILRSDAAALLQKMDSLSIGIATLRNEIFEKIDRVHGRIGAVDVRIRSLNDRLDTIGSHVVSLHEKTDSNAASINTRLDRIRPVVNAGDNLLMTRVDDFIMGLPAEDVRLAAALSFESLEPGLRKLIRGMITEGMVVIDIGAHIGLISLIAARQVGRSGKVHCFEPTPRTFQILQNNIAINNLEEQVVLRQIAITDRKGKAKLALRPVFGNNTLFPSREDTSFVEIETAALDELFKDAPRIDIVKIDAEGAEPFVLRGMKDIIARNPSITIFLEFAPSHLLRAGIAGKDFLADIRSLGLSFRQVTEPSGAIEPISDQELLNAFSVNLIIQREFTA